MVNGARARGGRVEVLQSVPSRNQSKKDRILDIMSSLLVRRNILSVATELSPVLLA